MLFHCFIHFLPLLSHTIILFLSEITLRNIHTFHGRNELTLFLLFIAAHLETVFDKKKYAAWQVKLSQESNHRLTNRLSSMQKERCVFLVSLILPAHMKQKEQLLPVTRNIGATSAIPSPCPIEFVHPVYTCSMHPDQLQHAWLRLCILPVRSESFPPEWDFTGEINSSGPPRSYQGYGERVSRQLRWPRYQESLQPENGILNYFRLFESASIGLSFLLGLNDSRWKRRAKERSFGGC